MWWRSGDPHIFLVDGREVCGFLLFRPTVHPPEGLDKQEMEEEITK
ncbi:hypothetical protein GS8_620 [Geobacillus stearothermophilus]|uniref:Uncharacterized protein n=1 Tax=Geobacillus stearothermophilus TaxID=1422 RepID=A0A150M7E0_GEOSE|nr:hypothetical protein GS8_620 [Geobacillus stearothermophilus]KYD20453.1 hypothetical protein B4109_1159 [Geobacillus stearothermophilus]